VNDSHLRRIWEVLGAGVAALLFAGAANAQAARVWPFRATNYDVEVLLHPENQSIEAQSKVTFVASQVSRTVSVELHPDLHVAAVKNDKGQTLSFSRDGSSPLLLSVALTEAATPGKQVTLTFEYDGPVSSLEDSPTRGVRFASVDKTSAYLLLPARWFPLTNYPSNRFTGTFRVVTPDTFVVAGTGKADPPATMAAIGKGQAQLSYVFHCDTAAANGSFVAGALQLSSTPVEGYKFSVYTPQAQANSAVSYAADAEKLMGYFSDTFGPLDVHDMTIAQMPDGSLAGYSAPGLLLLSARQWTTNKPNDALLAQLAAGQWWGNSVMAATPNDAWVTDGLAQYGSAMYAEQADGITGLHNALESYAVSALMYEGTAPIAQVQPLGQYSDQYRSIVQDKGAMVLHMLRTQLGDDAFGATLRDFYKQSAGKTATIDEFEKVASAHVPAVKPGDPAVNLLAFFSQWLNSTGVPEFTMDYVIYRTPKGFRVVGKVHQDLDTFRMPVELKLDTEGNPEFKKILVTGTTSQFQVETFGRPKPNGITIDPNDNLLKSSPHLRTMSLVARGEGLAQSGKYFEAIQEYQRALDVQPTDSLAHFRMAEAMFYQKNFNSAANEFRAAIGGDLDPKWVEVWGHIYLGKIYDILGQRERAVNEYTLAQHLRDDTAGAQEEANLYIQKAYNPGDAGTATASAVAPAPAATSQPAAAAEPGAPTLKRRTD
jgi:tetratricopeptide (TPR) repeat protein